jgi:hypothetical protein
MGCWSGSLVLIIAITEPIGITSFSLQRICSKIPSAVEGTSLSKSKVRLVIETDEMSYMFNGSIENTGICEVNIPKTKHFLPEGTKGNMRLEVIADDVYFEPWASDFSVKTNKKVNVVVSEQVEDKPKVNVVVAEQKEEPVKPKINEIKTVQTKRKVELTKQDILNRLMGK